MARVIGVMSGSSLDGLDIVLVDFKNSSWSLEKHKTITLARDLVQALESVTSQTAIEIAHTEAKYSAFVSTAIQKFIGEEEEILAVGIHGHTILHLPEIKTSWQLLNGGRIAAETDMTIVSDFRNQDLALGGQGTPMAVIADRDLYPGYEYYINLGGIANISHKVNDKRTAYDVCPCNQLLNHFSKKEGLLYDKDGLLAKSGVINSKLLDSLNTIPFFDLPSPKSLDNSWIKENFTKIIETFELSTADTLRTITESIVTQLTKVIVNPNSKILMSGGGTKNIFLIDLLKQKLAKRNVQVIVPAIQTIDYKEAILIAYCAWLRISKKANFISSATGASTSTIGGAVYLGKVESNNV